MTNPKPLLSICIATYNRSGYIGETLDSILPQLTSAVEIVVADGASTDATAEVVRQYEKRDSRVRYIRLPVKGGVDHDYDKAVEFASGEYCWLFTDDDILRPGGIAAVVRALEKGFDLVVVNAEVKSRNLDSLLQSRRAPFLKDRTYSQVEREEFFSDLLGYLSFIGAVVIKRSVWMSRERARYFGTEFIHVGVIFQSQLSTPVFFMAEPYVTIRFDNAQWEPRRFQIWMFKWPELIWSFPDFSESAKNKVTPREPWRDFRNLVVNRAAGGYDLHIYRKYFGQTRVGLMWKFGAILIACFPTGIVRAIRQIYRWAKG